ncbi:hypothetical protein CR513_20991, partial [Mucuna pruriens]
MEVGRYVLALIKSEQVSALVQPAMPKKCSDPDTFSIPCTIGKCNFDAMLDLGVSINEMPSSVYKSLRLGVLEPTSIVIQLANKSIAHSLGILEDVLVQVSDMIFPTNFYVLDMKDEFSSKGPTLILGRPFLKTSKTKIDVHARTLSLEFDVIDRLGDDYMNLHYEFPDFDDFKDYDCECTGLTEYPIDVEISNVINASAGIIDISKVVAVQPPLSSMVQPPVIIANKIQIEQKEKLLQNLKKLGDFYKHLINHSTLRFLLKKPPEHEWVLNKCGVIPQGVASDFLDFARSAKVQVISGAIDLQIGQMPTWTRIKPVSDADSIMDSDSDWSRTETLDSNWS